MRLAVPAPVMPGLRVAILGSGKMGGILLQAFLKNNLAVGRDISLQRCSMRTARWRCRRSSASR